MQVNSAIFHDRPPMQDGRHRLRLRFASGPEVDCQVVTSGFLNSGKQWRGGTLEGIEVGSFVVWDTVLPAAIQDADPLEGERTQCSLMRRALGTLLFVESSGPVGMRNRLGGPFDEGLAHERGALPAPVHP